MYYRDHWFWIDDRDWKSGRVLTGGMVFFTLGDTSTDERVPLITIPAAEPAEMYPATERKLWPRCSPTPAMIRIAVPLAPNAPRSVPLTLALPL